jgi:hypothetical protein
VTATFGSADDIQLLDALPLTRAGFVISTIPALDANKALLHGLRHHHYQGTIVLTAHIRHDAEELRAAGTDLVLDPFGIAANAASNTLDELLTDRRKGDHDDHGGGNEENH